MTHYVRNTQYDSGFGNFSVSMPGAQEVHDLTALATGGDDSAEVADLTQSLREPSGFRETMAGYDFLEMLKAGDLPDNPEQYGLTFVVQRGALTLPATLAVMHQDEILGKELSTDEIVKLLLQTG